MHLSTNSHNVGFSWLLRTVAFLIATQQWTTRSGYIGIVTAVASIRHPGEMDPASSLSILIGQNANITCRLHDPNSSEIWFNEVNSKNKTEKGSIDIKVIDNYTSTLMIHNAVEQKSRFQCLVGKHAIGETSLYVGTKPLNVTDFSCINHDYEYMECSFTKPRNMLLTTFNLEYRIEVNGKDFPCVIKKENNNKIQYSSTTYFPVRNEYLFTLTASNVFGKNVQQFTINNHEIAIPSALNINVHNETSNSVSLSWIFSKVGFYNSSVLYEIQLSDDNRNRTIICKTFNCKVLIENLSPYWHYSIEVRAKSMWPNNHFWSDPWRKQFYTKAKPATKPPKTPLGSFYIDGTETQLRLYWEQLPEMEHNGPDFHYVVEELNENDVVVSSLKTNETSVSLAWKNESIHRFLIKSANQYGASNEGNLIRVYRSDNPSYELNEKYIAKVYHNFSYTLTWSPPQNMDELSNYTVFWCLPKIELNNECKGPISYKYLDKYATYFTTEPEDRSLNLAISANYPNETKGMQWARCSGEIESELVKMELELNALNYSTILVKWNSDRVCTSMLTGYKLTYCQEKRDCVTIKLLREKQDYRNYTISNLPPYTKVCIKMLMYAVKTGPISEERCVRTKQSAPSPPKNLTYEPKKVTSKSAAISWNPPDVNNGILTHYTIYWRKYPDYTSEKNNTWINETTYNLTGLKSYSSYEVYVTAHTFEESLPSERINITTLIGIPSFVPNATIADNQTVVYWDQPHLPSGSNLFYVVALVQDSANKIERVSIIKGRRCQFHWPDYCPNTKMRYALKVRAVNEGDINEIDTEIKSMTEDEISEGAPTDDNFCVSDDDSKNMFKNGKFYFASEWKKVDQTNSCSPDSYVSIYVIASIILIAFGGYICYWIRRKYYKMKNIKVILPEGLVDQVSNHKFASKALSNGSNLGPSVKKEFYSDVSCSNDSLAICGLKEKQNLISNFHNGSSNALTSLSSNSNSKEHHNEDQIADHPSLETTNEELSSNSSSASNSILTYHDHHRIERLSSIDSNNTAACDEESDHDDPENLQCCTPTQNGGYVTHNSQLLASILNGTDSNVQSTPQFNATFPAMSNDGYIQPSAAKQLFQPTLSHLTSPPTTTLNGYTSIDALGKLSTLSEESTQHNSPIDVGTTSPTNTTTTAKSHPLIGNNVPSITTNVPTLNTTSSSHHPTSPVITDLHESTSADIHKETIPSSNGTYVPTTLTSQQPNNNNNNNNNNTIYGYVTQQQLANFGTTVALGKELNT